MNGKIKKLIELFDQLNELMPKVLTFISYLTLAVMAIKTILELI